MRFRRSFALLGLLGAAACATPGGGSSRDLASSEGGAVALRGAEDFALQVDPSVRVPLGGLAEVDVRKVSDVLYEPTALTAEGAPGLVVVPGVIRKYYERGSLRVGAEAPLAVGSTFTLRVTGRIGEIEHTVETRAIVVDREGSLDPSFGAHGTFIAPGDKYSVDAFYDLLTQPDGTLVAVGNHSTLVGEFFRVVHLLADGTPDPVWDHLQIGFPNRSISAVAYAVGRQSSGRLVMAGERREQVALAGVQPGGELDASFGDGGTKVLDLAGDAVARAMLVAPDDALIVAGYHNRRSLVARLLPDGSPDPGFGIGGFMELYFRGDVASQALDVALDREGRILVAGEAGSRAYLHRLRQVPDPGGLVGDGSLLPLPVGGEPAVAQKIAIQTDGRILVAGSLRRDGVSAVAVWRLLWDDGLDPSRDPSFGTGGLAVVPVPGSSTPLAGFALLPDGRMVIAANAAMNVTPDDPWSESARPLLVRLSVDGRVEPGGDAEGRVPVGLAPGNVLFSIEAAGEGEALLGFRWREGAPMGGLFAGVARVWR